MEVFNLGKVDWPESQLIYHALAGLGREALVLLSPSTPYVCIGYHQDARQDVDLDYCRDQGIPVFRREVGGGAVYLDGDQLFFQMILHRDNPAAPRHKDAFYRKFLEPVVETYRSVGIDARYKPVNDVLAGDRKISGTGVGEIGDCVVFVGNLIVDFDYRMMSRVLNVPDEKFRDKVHRTLEENLTTIRRELGQRAAAAWTEDRLNRRLIEAFEKVSGPMRPGDLDHEVRAEVRRLGGRMMTDAFLLNRTRKTPPGRNVKIRSGLHAVQRVAKANGGLIRADFNLADGRLSGLKLTGDFFCYPPDGVAALEAALEGAVPEEVRRILLDFFQQHDVDLPGVTVDDLAGVLR
jgi:lipoate-protein ligase A